MSDSQAYDLPFNIIHYETSLNTGHHPNKIKNNVGIGPV